MLSIERVDRRSARALFVSIGVVALVAAGCSGPSSSGEPHGSETTGRSLGWQDTLTGGADKLDVAEEISHFHSHFVAVRATIASPSPEGVGKRLGFLLQELLREANTTGSKANDASMLQNVIIIKEELERIREQVENLE